MLNDLIKNDGPVVQLPDYLKGVDATGTEELAQYISPGYVKIVQSMSKSLIRDGYKEGDVLVTPMGIHVAGPDEPFAFWPMFFYTEYLHTNPVGTEPFVIESTRDYDSVIAKRARDPEARVADDDTRYSEHLNYIGVIPSVSKEHPVVMSFARGSHKQGRNLATLIKMRNAPIFACRFQLTSKETSNKSGQTYFALVPENPHPDISAPFASEEDFEHLKQSYEKLMQSVIRVDYSADMDEDTSVEKDI